MAQSYIYNKYSKIYISNLNLSFGLFWSPDSAEVTSDISPRYLKLHISEGDPMLFLPKSISSPFSPSM